MSHAAAAWDLYYVYDNDFLREVRDLYVNGLTSGSVQLKPFGDAGNSDSQIWSDFNWQPDGKYEHFVKVAAIVFVTSCTVSEGWSHPECFFSALLPASVLLAGRMAAGCSVASPV